MLIMWLAGCLSCGCKASHNGGSCPFKHLETKEIYEANIKNPLMLASPGNRNDIHLKVLETWPVNCGQRSPKVFQCQRYLRPKPLEIQKDCSSQLAAHSSWRGDGGPGLSLGCRQLQLDETETW